MTEAPTAAAPAAQANGQAAEQAPWYKAEGFSPEMQGFVENKGWQENPAKAIEAYQNLEKHVGVPPDQLLKLPKAEDKDGWNGVYNRLGRPESPDGYGEIKAPEGLQVDTNRLKHFDGVFHGLGLTKAQRDGLAQATIEYEGAWAADLEKQVKTAQQQELDALQKEWGPKYSEREELAKRTVRQFLPGDEAEKVRMLDGIESAIGSAAMVKLFANIADGANMREDKIPGGDNSQRFGYTAEQAQSELAAIKSELSASNNRDRLAAYNEGKGADYDKIQRLNAIIASAKKAA